MFAKLAFLLLPKDLFQGHPTARLLRTSGWTYLCGVVVSLVLFAIAHPQYDHRVHLISAAVFLLSYVSIRVGVVNYSWIKFGALWSLLEVIYITGQTGGVAEQDKIHVLLQLALPLHDLIGQAGGVAAGLHRLAAVRDRHRLGADLAVVAGPDDSGLSRAVADVRGGAGRARGRDAGVLHPGIGSRHAQLVDGPLVDVAGAGASPDPVLKGQGHPGHVPDLGHQILTDVAAAGQCADFCGLECAINGHVIVLVRVVPLR